MLADELDYVVGVDTHRDQHTLAVVAAPSGGVVAQAVGARERTRLRGGGSLCAMSTRPAARVWAVEGAGIYGAGLARHLTGHGERVLEISRTPRDERRLRGKDDPLDAVARRARRSRARRSRFPASGSDARRCGYCWSHAAARSRCAAERSYSCAA